MCDFVSCTRARIQPPSGSSHDMIRAASTAPRRILATSLRIRHKHLTPPLTTRLCVPVVTPTTRTYTPLRRATYATMSSATSFFDFKPADSTLLSCHETPRRHIHALVQVAPLTQWNREGPTLRPGKAEQQSRPRRQHRLQVRLHTAIRRPREALQGPEGAIPR